MGLFAHNTRESKVFRIEFDHSATSQERKESHSPLCNMKIISAQDDKSCFSLRKSPSERFLVYFSTGEEKIHHSSARLRLIDLETEENKLIVEEKNPKFEQDFPGIFAYSQPERIWSENEEFVLIHSYFRSKKRLIQVHLQSSAKISFIDLEDRDASTFLHDFHCNRLLCSLSSPNSPHEIWMCNIKSGLNIKDSNEWVKIKCSDANFTKFPQWELIQIPTEFLF